MEITFHNMIHSMIYFFLIQEAAITYTSLRYLSKDDIKEAIPPIGLRAEFREKLFSWRKSEFGIDDETLSGSIASKVALWLQSQSTVTTTATPTSSFCAAVDRSQLSKKLKLVLQESLKGKALTQFYANNGYLIDSFRADLIIIILEDILFHDRKLSPKDFPPIIEEILNEFPNELKEYYFIPRGKKKNPGGKLWDRYVNQRAKRAKLSVKFSDNFEVADANAQCTTNTEIDEPILLALKVSLSRDFSNWGDIKDKWQRTFLLRQKELKTTPTNYEFLNNWPLYSNARAHELINIDFELLHPNKSHLLLSKWNEFRTKIGNYYGLHINDRKSKELLTNSKSITDPRFSLCLRLNEVIIPTHTVRGSTTRLECHYELDSEDLYSVKWYKDGNEFYRYVPRDMPPAQVFPQIGVNVDLQNSTDKVVVLQSITLQTSGRYRCEVSGEAPSFQTVSDHGDMVVVAVPDEGPRITGGRPRYQIGDMVRVNCTSGRSKPATHLSWFINAEPVNQSFLRRYETKITGREGLETTTLGLEFKVKPKHFRNGDMKLKCLATIASLYWRSNEESVEGDRQQKVSSLEVKDTAYASNSRADRVQASNSASHISSPVVKLNFINSLIACTSILSILYSR